MKFRPTYIFILSLSFTIQSVIAESVTEDDIAKAQISMLNRVTEAVKSYANSIQIDSEFITYCRSEMRLHTFNHPKDGSVPFGVNYNKINDSSQLDTIISVRENFERSYLITCLAKIKNELSEAAKK